MLGPEHKVGIVAIICATLALLGLMGSCANDAVEDKQHKQAVIEKCLQSGGSWETQQIDRDYQPVYVCTRNDSQGPNNDEN